MTTTLQQQGRRLYFRGAPYSSKDTLKAAGARWDPEERCWWMGTSKRTVAEELVTQIAAAVEGFSEVSEWQEADVAW